MQGDKAEPGFNQNKENTRNLNSVGESLHDKSSFKPVLCTAKVKLFKDNNKNSGSEQYTSKEERRLPSDEARTTRSITAEKITETGISKLTTSTYAYLTDAEKSLE